MTSSTSVSRGAATGALLSLALGAFGIGMTEFVSMGLLPGIAADLLPAVHAARPEDAVAQAGVLISLYALGVVVGAPTIAALVSRFPRHRVLVALALALLVFNALTVVMPTFGLVGLSRFLSGLPHGAYFGMAAIVAADLLGPARRGRAIAIVMSGLSIANLVGVPAGTWLGQLLGWRAAYLVVAAVFLTALILIAFLVPPQPGDAGRTFRHELRVFRIPQVWFTIAVGSIGFGAFFAVYSYVATLVTEVAGATERIVPLALIAIGLGMTVGTFVGGALADRSVRRTLVYGLAALAAASVVVGAVSHSVALLLPALFVFATASATATPTVQLRLLDVAHGHQAIGAALNHSALNVGNSLGAALGGAVIAAGWGYAAPVWTGAVLALLGVGIAVAAFAADRGAPRAAADALVPEDTGTAPVPTA